MSNFAYLGTDVGERVEYAVRVDCAKQGCSPKHSDDGRVVMCRSEKEAAEFAEHGVGGHAYTGVRRTVVLPPWQVVAVPFTTEEKVQFRKDWDQWVGS